jgi:6-phosphogluconolactonase
MPKLEIIEGADDGAIAAWFAERLRAALATSPDDIAITVPGGSTPFPIFDRLAAMDLPWSRSAHGSCR